VQNGRSLPKSGWLLSFKTQHSKFKIARCALYHSQAREIRQRVSVFRNSLFAVRLREELWMRMSTGAEQQGEGIIGNKRLTYFATESVCGELLVTGDW
jgi:hypothetical protein